MYCPKCGTLNPDTASVCVYCGEALTSETPAAAAYVPYEPPQPDHRFGEAIRKTLSAPVFLVLAVAYTANLIFSVMTTFFPGKQLTELLERVQEYFGEAGVPVTLQTQNGFSFSVSWLINILIIVALWTLYVSAKNGTILGKKSWQFSVLRIVSIISAVALGITSAITLLMTPLLFFAKTALEGEINRPEIRDAIREITEAAREEFGFELQISAEEIVSGLFTALIAILIFAAAVIAFTMVYYIVFAKCMNKADRALQGEEINAKGVTFIAVLAAISGVFGVFGLFGSVIGVLTDLSSPFILLSSVASVVFQFALCAVFLRAKREILSV